MHPQEEERAFLLRQESGRAGSTVTITHSYAEPPPIWNQKAIISRPGWATPHLRSHFIERCVRSLFISEKEHRAKVEFRGVVLDDCQRAEGC